MKKTISNSIHLWTVCLLAGIAFTACSDWTAVESVAIDQPVISDQNPALYAAYLSDLRNYKTSDHPVTIAWFNNQHKTPLSRADHLSVLPDSIDFVSLVVPDTLSLFEREEMETTRTEKGTRFLFDMSFEAIKLVYEEKVAELESLPVEEDDPPVVIPAFVDFLVDTVNQILPLVKRYDYDGLIIGYRGKSILHMTDAERLIFTSYEKAFIGIAQDWYTRNPGRIILFEGYPQNLLDKSILQHCAYIIIPCVDAGNASKINYNILSAKAGDVPVDRFVISVETPSLGKSDTKTGIWADGVTLAVDGASLRVAGMHEGQPLAGLGIKNVNNDYFNIARIYPHTRDAIYTMNPSPKK